MGWTGRWRGCCGRRPASARNWIRSWTLTSFGIAPAVLLYFYEPGGLQNVPFWGLALAFLFVMSGAGRLARFRVVDPYRGQRGYLGLPITTAAGFVAAYVIALESVDGVGPAVFADRRTAGGGVLVRAAGDAGAAGVANPLFQADQESQGADSVRGAAGHAVHPVRGDRSAPGDLRLWHLVCVHFPVFLPPFPVAFAPGGGAGTRRGSWAGRRRRSHEPCRICRDLRPA